MDRLAMESERALLLAKRRRTGLLILFSVVLLAVLAIKAFNDGWFEPQIPLELNNQPALVFFTLEDGCECQMTVIYAAEAQLADWPIAAAEEVIPILRVDYSRRPDVANLYNVRRAPALLLLDAQGQAVWKQDLGVSDNAPLDLKTAEMKILQMEEHLP